jgi:hypothetical protein
VKRKERAKERDRNDFVSGRADKAKRCRKQGEGLGRCHEPPTVPAHIKADERSVLELAPRSTRLLADGTDGGRGGVVVGTDT